MMKWPVLFPGPGFGIAASMPHDSCPVNSRVESFRVPSGSEQVLDHPDNSACATQMAARDEGRSNAAVAVE